MKQKLTKFAESIQSETSLWQAIENHHKTNRILKVKDIPPLENIVTDIFMTKNL